jgi:SAP domain-containing new25
MLGSKPAFSDKMPVSEFDSHYWYRDELARICSQHGLVASGTKAELQARVRSWLQSGKRETRSARASVSRRRKEADAGKPIQLSTRLIPDGFKFDNRARAFFAQHYGVPKFHFTKQMAEALRAAEARGDMRMTVKDLMRIYERAESLKASGRLVSRSREEKTYQWNHFVRAFHKDPRTRQFKQPLKAAAELWRRIRERAGSKEYSSQLLTEYAKQLARYTAK